MVVLLIKLSFDFFLATIRHFSLFSEVYFVLIALLCLQTPIYFFICGVLSLLVIKGCMQLMSWTTQGLGVRVFGSGSGRFFSDPGLFGS